MYSYVVNHSCKLVKLPSICVKTFSDTFHVGTWNLKKHWNVICAPCGTGNWPKYLFHRVNLLYTQDRFHVTPHMIRCVVIRWPWRLVVCTVTTDPSLRDLLIQTLLDDPTAASCCSTSDVALVEEHSLRGLALHVSEKATLVLPVRHCQQMYVPRSWSLMITHTLTKNRRW
jgi:hypothetical protein